MKTRLGDYPVIGYIKVGRLDVPQTGVVDTFTRYSVLPADVATAAGAKPTGRAGTLKMLKRQIHGRLVRVRMESLDGNCGGETTALVPDAGQDWKRGVVLGGEFLQDTGMHVNAHGEAYCPVRRRRR